MSNRALVAVARSDGRYDVHYSHGGGADERLQRLRRPDAGPSRDLVEGPAIARGLSFEALLADHLDPIEHEALVVVDPEGQVTPYVVLPYLLATADGLVGSAPRGAVLALVGRDGSRLHPAYVRGWFHGAAESLGEAVDADLLSPGEALGWLDDGIRRLAGDRYPLAVVP